MATQELTPTQDKAVRSVLATSAKSARLVYMGDYVDTNTNTTLGDRLQKWQVVNVREDGVNVRYLLIANVLVTRKSGGAVLIRVSAWSLHGSRVIGQWAVSAKHEGMVNFMKGVKLTPQGFMARESGRNVTVNINARLSTVLRMAHETLTSDNYMAPVQVIKHYGPSDVRYGETYDETERHLHAVGGSKGARALLKADK